MGKLCVIDIIAPLYRKRIFQLLDSAFDCIWMFGKAQGGIKELNLNELSNVRDAKNIKLMGPIYYQKGCVQSFFKKDISTFIVNGEPFCLSSWALALMALFSKKKHVYFWSHGWYGRESSLKKIIKKIYFRLPTSSFIYGNYAKSLMIKEGFPERKMIVIHNSLDYDTQLSLRNQLSPSSIYLDHFKNPNPTLIFIGRLTFSKKVDMLLQVIADLSNKGQNVNLVLVGDGEAKKSLLDIAARLHIKEKVWFYGACYDEKENAELIYNADVCVSPGNVGLTAIHCLMFGTPVITHNNFAYQGPEFEAIRQNETGDFFVQGDIKSLQEKVSHWLTKKDCVREEVRKACYKEIDSYWTPNYQMDIFKKNLLIK